MLNFQDTFKTRKRSFISAFSICMTVPLNKGRVLVVVVLVVLVIIVKGVILLVVINFSFL